MIAFALSTSSYDEEAPVGVSSQLSLAQAWVGNRLTWQLHDDGIWIAEDTLNDTVGWIIRSFDVDADLAPSTRGSTTDQG